MLLSIQSWPFTGYTRSTNAIDIHIFSFYVVYSGGKFTGCVSSLQPTAMASIAYDRITSSLSLSLSAFSFSNANQLRGAAAKRDNAAGNGEGIS